MTDITSKKRLNFIFPARSSGGVQNAFFLMCARLSARGQRYRLFDYSWGYILNRLRSEGVEIPEFVLLDGQAKIADQFGDDDVIVGTNEHLLTFSSYLRGARVKILFWDVIGIFWQDFLRFKIKGRRLFDFSSQRRNLMQLLVKKNAICFMDSKAREAFEHEAGVKIRDPLYLHLGVVCSSTPLARPKIDPSNVRVVYLGRPELWKVRPAEHVAREMSQSTRFKVHTSIVTTEADTFSSRITDKQLARQLEYVTGLFGRSLDDYLRTEVDLLIAMGTSVLEGARFGLPSMVVDAALKPLDPTYRGRWFHKCTGYDVGGDAHDANAPVGESCDEILSALVADADAIGRACWERTNAHFSLEHTIDTLVSAVDDTTLTMQDLQKFWAVLLALARINMAPNRTFERLRFRAY